MITTFPDFFSFKYSTSARNFSRELLLDPSECENSLYVLPQLTRDAFCRKELFNRVENLIIQSYNQCFQYPSAPKAKEQLGKAEELLKTVIGTPSFRACFMELTSGELRIS